MERRKRRQKAVILRDVSDRRLFAAVCAILRQRYLRAHPELDPETFVWEPEPEEIDVQGFIDESSIRQVQMLRDIALGLEEQVEHIQ
jgi:protein-L-isoaspartate O-methyltransferase